MRDADLVVGAVLVAGALRTNAQQPARTPVACASLDLLARHDNAARVAGIEADERVLSDLGAVDSLSLDLIDGALGALLREARNGH